MASVGSTLKDSEIQDCATSIDSRSSSERVPSVKEVLRKSMIASARRCLVVAMIRNRISSDIYCMSWEKVRTSKAEMSSCLDLWRGAGIDEGARMFWKERGVT